ncbi:MAG: hypothetical protein HQM06_13400 [Magnetococcales bacterium]|nr:hypothetical protein [Magnetococcales bacterium]
MKERPILFSGPMVRAILEGRKTQTRRIVKAVQGFHCPDEMWPAAISDVVEWREQEGLWFGLMGYSTLCTASSPYGKPGDRLWVRETFAMAQPGSLPVYRADAIDKNGDAWPSIFPGDPDNEVRWTPSIHMPRSASRILLEITGIRVERLQDISEEDAQEEGSIEWMHHMKMPPPPICSDTGRIAFTHLWESINGTGSWDANLWVWVVDFKKVAA